MGIAKNIKIGVLFLWMLPGGLFLSACNDGELWDAGSDGNDTETAGSDTYYNFILRLPSASPAGAANPVGTAEENAVKNIAIILFDKEQNNYYETGGYFELADLVVEDGSGNLGSAVTDGVTLKKAIPVTAGEKTVVAVINCNPYIREALNASAGPGVTYEQFHQYQYSLLPAGATWPERLDLPKYGYTAPVPAGVLDLSRLGIEGAVPSLTDGMLMTGTATIRLESDVAESDVLSGLRNTVVIEADRIAAKVSLRLAGSLRRETCTNPGNPAFTNIFYQPDIETPIVSAEWWVANLPAEGFLLEHPTGLKHPYYRRSSDFSVWQNKQPATTTELDQSEHCAYMPENLVSTPVRGNVTYLAVKAKFDLYNIADGKNFPVSSDLVPDGYHLLLGGIYSDNVASPPGWDQVYSPLPRGSFTDDVLVLTNEQGERKYLLYDSSLHGDSEESKDRLKWIETFLCYIYSYPDSPRKVKACYMPSDSRLQADQDAVAFDGQVTIEPGWYGFYYDSKTLHAGKWYDEMIFYYYSGEKDASGNWQREQRRSYTAALYKQGYCYYRIDLEDDTRSVAEERFAVNRNTWFDVEITKIKELGYPDEEDLAACPDKELMSSAIEVQISVQNWRDGGKQNEVIGQ